VNNPHYSHGHSVRRIVLPSGRSIEVVRFHESSQSGQRPLYLCPDCHSDLVQPRAWSETEDERWELTLECPNCWWNTEGVFSQAQVHELEEHLDDGLAQMLGDLKRLAHANMAEQIDRFAAALNADAIVPEDF
jgi:hypothetical protein